MHKDLCFGLSGLCDAMRPTKGADLLKYLRKVNFKGKLEATKQFRTVDKWHNKSAKLDEKSIGANFDSEFSLVFAYCSQSFISLEFRFEWRSISF